MLVFVEFLVVVHRVFVRFQRVFYPGWGGGGTHIYVYCLKTSLQFDKFATGNKN